MNPADTIRAGILLRSRDQIEEMLRDSERTEPDKYEGDWRGVAVDVAGFNMFGSVSSAFCQLDMVTGRKLIVMLGELISAELRDLGVEE